MFLAFYWKGFPERRNIVIFRGRLVKHSSPNFAANRAEVEVVDKDRAWPLMQPAKMALALENLLAFKPEELMHERLQVVTKAPRRGQM